MPREQISAIDRLWCLDRCRKEGKDHFWCNTLYGPGNSLKNVLKLVLKLFDLGEMKCFAIPILLILITNVIIGFSKGGKKGGQN